MTAIDNPDLAEALAADQDGTFRAELTAYLGTWREKVNQARSVGLPPGDYEAANRLTNSINQAEKLLEFFATLKVLATGAAKQPD
jgi:hypothetical protein